MELIFHPMLLPIGAPFLTGLFCLLIPRRIQTLTTVLAILATASTVLLVWPLFAKPDQVLEIGSRFALRSDSLSGFILLAVALFGLLIALYSAGYVHGHERQREYFAYLLWTVGASLGAVMANDLIVFLVFWGFLGLTLYAMIGIAGADAAEAARKSLMIVGGADALLVFGVVLLWHLSGSTRMDAGPIALNGAGANIAFLAVMSAAFAKAGAVPFHAWVPDCGEKAQASVSAFLPASLDKLLGIYLLARCVLDLFDITAAMQTVLMLLGGVTVIAAVLMALVQHDLKRLLAYHAVSQVGYMVLGIGTGTAIGMAGGLFHMLNNAVYKCCLFLCAGAVEQASGTTDLDRLGGLAKSMPLTFAACTVAALSISGIPPLNGFASKWMVYQGIISSGSGGSPGWIIWLVAAMLGSALTLASFVKVLHATFLCNPAPNIAKKSIREAGITMLIPMIFLALVCIVFGVFAYAVPLKWLIFPAVPAAVMGVWSAGLATVLILAAIAIGALIYLLTMFAGRLRRVGTYVGGEHLAEVYIRGEAPGPERYVEVTGVDFYRTLEQLPGLRQVFYFIKGRAFDLYDLIASGSGYVVALLRGAHSGAMAIYMSWFLAGLAGIVFVMLWVGG
jgi:formate hydrogenlyase subunit 3/multisubunit Na+/H+ antiporter MnhD subunit